MQQRQLRLGDILDDYCPRERRLTNHAVVAMIGPDVRQTRCTTCDAEHEYKHAKVPRHRRKGETAALAAHVLANGPARVAAEPAADAPDEAIDQAVEAASSQGPESGEPAEPASDENRDENRDDAAHEDGPVHRALIRATLPRVHGQPPPQRPAPQFTIREPAGRPNRFRERFSRGGQPFQGTRGNAPGGSHRGGMHRAGGRPPTSRTTDHRGGGRKRSK